MQHFLKPATGTAGTEIIAPQFLIQFLVTVNNAHPTLDHRFRRETPATLAGFLVESTVRQIVFS